MPRSLRERLSIAQVTHHRCQWHHDVHGRLLAVVPLYLDECFSGKQLARQLRAAGRRGSARRHIVGALL